MTRTRLAILISGRGSNMQALLDAADNPAYPGEPMLILSNRPNAAGLEAARVRGLKTVCVDHTAFGGDRQAFEEAVDAILRAERIEFIALAGFMRVLTPWFVRRWSGRLVNIHPSLLPRYRGLDTHRRAIEAGDREAGCSVHYVTEGVDEGEVIAQARVPILPGDTPDRLAARILVEEHRLYPRALEIALQRLRAGA